MKVGKQAPDDPDTTEWTGDLRASQATIEEVHASGRDRVLAPFPCFLTNAYFAPGMSGGPIVSRGGRVVGVVSRGFEREHRTAEGLRKGPDEFQDRGREASASGGSCAVAYASGCGCFIGERGGGSQRS
jgi:hypothetical protein